MLRYFLVGLVWLVPSVLFAKQDAPANPAPVPEKEPEQISPYVQALRAGMEAAKNENCEKAITLFQPLVEAKQSFSRITEEGQLSVLRRFFTCARKTENYPLQYSISKSLIPLIENPTGLLLHRLNMAIFYKQPNEALQAFRGVYTRAPSRFSDYKAKMYWRFLALLRKHDLEEERTEVLQKLHDAQYTAPTPIANSTGFTFELMIALNNSGRQKEALPLLKNVKGTKKLLTVMVDKRYDVLRRSLKQNGRANLLTEAQNDLARNQKFAAKNPDQMAPVLWLAQSYRAVGQPTSALTAIKVALERHNKDPENFSDSEEYLPWLLNEQAYAFYDLGKVVDGHKTLEEASELKEEKTNNVSQTINRAEKLVAYGAREQALALLKAFSTDETSDYGKMWVYSNRVCAQAFMEDTPISTLDMLALRANKKDNLPALQLALLCANLQDEAAALYIERLQNPQERTAVLIALQKYRALEFPSPYQTTMRQRVAEIRQRKDVQAQIKKVGYIQQTSLVSTYWGTF